MFERFTRDARTVVVATQYLCRSLGTDEVRPVHLLLALTEEGSSTRDTLAAHGITTDAVSAALGADGPVPPAPPEPPAPLGDGDAAALRSLGIDLDAIRDAVERQFGQGALDPAAEPPDDRGGGHVRFGRGSKKVLELAVREAIRGRSGEIRAEHLALGVLRTDDEAIRLLLRTLAVDPRAVRADLEGPGRRSA